MQRINKVCGHCGSADVWTDANAEWNPDLQDWVLLNVFDNAYCEECSEETSLTNVPLNAAERTHSNES